MSSKLAFPQFALLEQNLQISYHVLHSCEYQPRYKMPAYSVVKDRCVRNCWTVPLPVERSPHLQRGKTIKNPASSAGPSRPNLPRTGSRDARLICYPEFVIDLACDRPIETLNAPDSHIYSSDEWRVYQNLLARQAVLFTSLKIL